VHLNCVRLQYLLGTFHVHILLRLETKESVSILSELPRPPEFNNGRVPFASAQIGWSFRNKTSPALGSSACVSSRWPSSRPTSDSTKPGTSRSSSRWTRGVRRLTVSVVVTDGTIAKETPEYFLLRIARFCTRSGCYG
jgi:hypothetical protein